MKRLPDTKEECNVRIIKIVSEWVKDGKIDVNSAKRILKSVFPEQSNKLIETQIKELCH
jgi:polyhydroxyalkanoate synthesis regulator phasin